MTSRHFAKSSFSRAWLPYAVLAGALLITFLVAFYIHRTTLAKDRSRFEHSVQQMSSVIDNRLDTYEALLRAGAGLFAASEIVEPDEFRRFVKEIDLPSHYQGVQGLGFSVRLKPEEKDKLIDKMRSSGNPGFKIWPEGNRAEYHSIIYLEPLNRRNEQAIGYDMFTEPVRRAAMEQARDTGSPASSGRVTLVQEIDQQKQAGFLTYVPVYLNGAKIDSTEERRAALIGFVYAPFRAGDLMRTILGDQTFTGVNYKVFDGYQTSADDLLFDSSVGHGPVTEAPRFRATTTISVSGRSWTLEFSSAPDFEAVSAGIFSTLALLVGGFLSFVLYAITWSQTRTQTRAERALRELRATEKSLRRSLKERKEAEAALVESKEKLLLANYRFRVAEEASKSFNYDWNLQTDTVVRSDNFSQVLGYGVGEIAETWEAWKAITHPADFRFSKQEAIAYLDKLDGDLLEAEYRVLHKDGEYRTLYNRGIILRDEQGKARRVIGQTVDITEHKLAQAKALAANEIAIVEYEHLLERIGALAQEFGAARELMPIYRALRDFAIASVPCNGLFVSLYDSAHDVRTASYGWGDGIEVDVSQLPPMPITIDGPNSRAVRTGAVVITDDYMKATSGHPQVIVGPENNLRPQSSMAVPMALQGRIVGTIEIQSYETAAYKQTHATAMRMAANLAAVAIESARLLARETEARAEAEESNRLKDEFLATVSHELRTPLTAILGWARMLDSESLDAEQKRRALKTIQRNAKAQAEIVDDILDVSRIITGNLYLNLEPTELQPVLEAAINAVRPTAEAKRIQIETSFDGEPALVSADAHRLQQVVWNLVSNAVKFTPAGGRVRVKTYKTTGYANLEVSDTGQGITSDFLPHVFERFRQADSSTTRLHGGLGLGLAIVRHLVEIHGGSVRVDSEGTGKGATFTVALPLLVDGAISLQPSNRSEDLKLETSLELRGVRVLLVDDDAGTREIISAVLNERQADVTAVGSAREALIEINRGRPDVLISDIAMPVEDGYKLIEQVRGLFPPDGITLPAIAITAYAREEDRSRALAAGYQTYLPKPIEPAELVSAIAALVTNGAVTEAENSH